MKLISCYIEGYGKIKRREYTFSDGVNTFCEENGEGKTTLASFLKAMLYGLKGYGKRSVEFCDREHFYPFDGGLFGGNLTLQAGKDIYKIERFFGEKSETADSLKVYRNGEQTTELGENIGKALLGVDRESFERTTFFGSGDVEISSTSDIHAQLNRFLGCNAKQTGGLDEALEALEKAAKAYKKSRAGNDKVSATSAKIDELRHEIENAATVKRALEGKYAKAESLQEEIAALNARMVLAQEEKEKRSQVEHYESLLESAARAESALRVIEAKYPLGIPSEEETEGASGYAAQANELAIKAERAGLPAADEERLSALNRGFAGGVPTEETLVAVEEDIRLLGEQKAKLAATEGARAQLPFDGGKKNFAAAGYGLLAAGILLLLTGVVATLLQRFWGIALAGVGGIGVLFGAILFRKQQSAVKARLAREQTLGEIEELRRRTESIEADLTAFFARYGLTGETPIAMLGRLRSLRGEYASLSARKEAAMREETALQADLLAAREELQRFQRRYGLREIRLVELREDIRESARLRAAIAETRAQAARYKADKGLDEYAARQVSDLTELQFACSAAQNEKSKLDREIADDERLAEKLEGYEADLASAEELLKEYKRKHGLLTAAAELLRRADGRLRDKYVKPVKEEFLRYANVIERALGERVVVTKEFELRFERNGMERSERHFSTGQRSVCALCFRLALVKNMYREERPFLILDDPFTGLDEKHMAKVAEAIKELSEDMQTLYFTCHESRKI